jgi:hypothetical protein
MNSLISNLSASHSFFMACLYFLSGSWPFRVAPASSHKKRRRRLLSAPVCSLFKESNFAVGAYPFAGCGLTCKTASYAEFPYIYAG